MSTKHRPTYGELYELAEDVASGNSEYDTLSEIAAALLEGREPRIDENGEAIDS